MKPLTLVAHQRYAGLDPMRLREAAGRVLTRLFGLPTGRARVRADHVKHDFGVDTIAGDALVQRLVDEGLLRPDATQPGDYQVTEQLRDVAAARVVEPLPRDKARQLVTQAVELVRDINSLWHRNPIEVEALAVCGSYMSRDARLCELTFGVVVRNRAADRRARWGRMGNQGAGAQEIRMALEELSSFVIVHFVTEVQALPRPFSVVHRELS